MNITLLANRDLASNYALNLLLPQLAGHRLSLFLSDRVGSSGNKPAELNQLKFFEQTLFNDLICPLLPPVAERPGKLRSFDQFSDYLNQPAPTLNAINSEAGLQMLRDTHPDLILSIRYGGILKNDAIGCAKQGVLNLHSGLLPAYRGVMATFWAMHNGETEIGTTLHWIEDVSIDTGGVITTTRLPVDSGKSYLWHVLNLYPRGVASMADAVAAIASGQRPLSQPQSGDGNYYSFPQQTDLARFFARDLTLVEEQEVVSFFRDMYYP